MNASRALRAAGSSLLRLPAIAAAALIALVLLIVVVRFLAWVR